MIHRIILATDIKEYYNLKMHLMIKFLKYFSLILLGLTMLFQTNLAQEAVSKVVLYPQTPQGGLSKYLSINKSPLGDLGVADQKRAFETASVTKTVPLFSGLHTLSIHVRDTITHDSVFHFLIDKLKLPVYYYPVASGKRKYAGIYAGNLVLEPCGPYTNYLYGTNNFRAIFFGLTFEPFESLSLTAMGLTGRKINHQADDTYINLQKDTALCGDNITIGFMDRGPAKTIDKRIMDSLRYALNADKEKKYKVISDRINGEMPTNYTSVNYYNESGIEYVKEICIGYRDNSNLQKWKELISPFELINDEIWKVSNILDFHIIKSNIKEVQSITFKVKSLERVKRYLIKNNLFGSFVGDKIQLDKAQAFGLSIYLTDED